MTRHTALSRTPVFPYLGLLSLLALSANAWAISVPSWSQNGNYTVSWSAPTGCQNYYSPDYPYPFDHYECYYLQEKAGSGGWTDVSVPNGSTSWNASGKPPNTYQYQIRMIWGYYYPNYGVAEEPVSITVGPAPPTDPLMTQLTYEYETRTGDINSDGRTDIFVRRTSGGVSGNGVLERVILRQNNSPGTFSLLAPPPESAQWTTASGWPLSSASIEKTDFNVDGFVDIEVKGVAAAVGVAGAFDQIVFSPAAFYQTQPLGLRAIDESVRRFFRDASGNMKNLYYYIQTAVANDWYHLEEGQNVTGYWAINYLRYWNFCWYDCSVRAADSDIEDIFDQNATPDLCFTFGCFWSTDRWYAWVTAREVELVIHNENFSQTARNLEGVIDSLITNGELNCASSEAVALENALYEILGVEPWGGVLSSCGILESESGFDPNELDHTRLGALLVFLQVADSRVQPSADRGDPNENQADLEVALTYLAGSATFNVLWEQFQELGVELAVHRNAPRGTEFNPPDEVIWDPDNGIVLEEGIGSPASGLAHEVAHAVRYQTDREGFLQDYAPQTEATPDPNDPTLTRYRLIVPEEERAADVEALIQGELGEPQRVDYADGDVILIGDPTFSCFRGTPTCDALIP